MSTPLHAVDNFFKRQVLSRFTKPDSDDAISRVRRDMRQVNGDHIQQMLKLREPISQRPVAEICFEGE